MNDTLNMDVAGGLFTNIYRNTKIKGKEPPAVSLEGTGSVSTAAEQQRKYKQCSNVLTGVSCNHWTLALHAMWQSMPCLGRWCRLV